MGKVEFEIIKEHLRLNSGKRLVTIKWGKNKPTLDIRKFGEDDTPFKGISLSFKEAKKIAKAILELDFDEDGDEPDERESIDLMKELEGTPDIVEKRKRGYVTKNGKIQK